jgi:large subunit ribosomal protein L6
MPKKTIKLKQEIEIPENVEITIEGPLIKVKGPKGELSRQLYDPRIKITKKEKLLLLEVTKKPTKREKKVLGTFKAHIKNLIQGSIEPFTYKLKICSAHFPMNVAVENDVLVIKNFLGEKIPRKAKILPEVKVKVEGDTVVIESANKEKAGQTASNIEAATKIKGRDPRRFTDGIWMFFKGGKEIK